MLKMSTSNLKMAAMHFMYDRTNGKATSLFTK